MFQARLLNRLAKLAHPVGYDMLCSVTFCDIAEYGAKILNEKRLSKPI